MVAFFLILLMFLLYFSVPVLQEPSTIHREKEGTSCHLCLQHSTAN